MRMCVFYLIDLFFFHIQYICHFYQETNDVVHKFRYPTSFSKKSYWLEDAYTIVQDICLL